MDEGQSTPGSMQVCGSYYFLVGFLFMLPFHEDVESMLRESPLFTQIKNSCLAHACNARPAAWGHVQKVTRPEMHAVQGDYAAMRLALEEFLDSPQR